jgi:hypothetical protein
MPLRLAKQCTGCNTVKAADVTINRWKEVLLCTYDSQ